MRCKQAVKWGCVGPAVVLSLLVWFLYIGMLLGERQYASPENQLREFEKTFLGKSCPGAEALVLDHQVAGLAFEDFRYQTRFKMSENCIELAIKSALASDFYMVTGHFEKQTERSGYTETLKRVDANTIVWTRDQI